MWECLCVYVGGVCMCVYGACVYGVCVYGACVYSMYVGVDGACVFVCMHACARVSACPFFSAHARA